jgi:DNA-binding response OmpR family regulator
LPLIPIRGFDLYGDPEKLTATENRIMELLMKNPGRIFPLRRAINGLGGARLQCENTVMVHIRRIREKTRSTLKSPSI